MDGKKIYRKCLIFALAINIIAITLLLYQRIDRKIPDSIKMFVNQQEKFNFSAPVKGILQNNDASVMSQGTKKITSGQIHINMTQPFTLESGIKGSYNMDLKLFGLIHLKNIKIDVIDSVKLAPSGLPIGIYLKTDGVLVLGTGPVLCVDGLNYEPAVHILKSGDYIKEAGGKQIHNKDELIKAVNESGGKDIILRVRRGNELISVTVKPVRTPSKEYKIGAWVRDDTQGIGTMTFTDSQGNFGALGHGITDVDTGVLMNTKKGFIYPASILSIVKGENGKPGEIIGSIDRSDSEKLGVIRRNTNQGIFGQLEKKIDKSKFLNIGLKQEVKKGKAYIYCKVTDKIEKYEIEIEKVDCSNRKITKGLVLKITDPRLLRETNGIIQGMSGSPIIQNGKLIGAVTHVFIEDSTKGYGTFIENMLRQSE